MAEITAVLAYYNEVDFIEPTLMSLANQRHPLARLVLVDNASTDGSADKVMAVMARHSHVPVTHLHEATPGHMHALRTGTAAVETPLMMYCDADSHYPPGYTEWVDRLFRQNGANTVAVLAADAPMPDQPGHGFKCGKTALMGRLLAKQCHTGSFAFAFRTEVLRQAGGFDPDHWPHVLYDHELMHRMLKLGRGVYHSKHWCATSDRRGPHDANTRWDLTERLFYHASPFPLKDWFFYTFLAKRLAARKMGQENIRSSREWQSDTER